jgi:hypothetical protein
MKLYPKKEPGLYPYIRHLTTVLDQTTHFLINTGIPQTEHNRHNIIILALHRNANVPISIIVKTAPVSLQATA